MAEPLFRHEGSAHQPPAGDAEAAGVLAADAHRGGILLRHLAGNGFEELALAVAGDAGNADHFAGAYGQVDVSERDRERRRRLAAERADFKQRLRGLDTLGRRAHHGLHVVADHHAGQRCRGFLARIAMANHLAVAQHGGAVADALYLFQPVRNVEDRLSFRAQPFERLEQLVGFLRRQHRGRLVQDDELRRLQQAADDLDTLALTDREVADQRLRIERQAVAIGKRPRLRGDRADRRARRPATARCSRPPSVPRTAKNAGTPCRCRASCATPGLVIVTGWPFQKISPELGSSDPNSILTSVDLPAPFSPSNAWISPLATVRSIWSHAVSVPNDLGKATHLKQVCVVLICTHSASHLVCQMFCVPAGMVCAACCRRKAAPVLKELQEFQRNPNIPLGNENVVSRSSCGLQDRHAPCRRPRACSAD